VGAGGAIWRAELVIRSRFGVRKMNESAGSSGEGIEEDMSRSISCMKHQSIEGYCAVTVEYNTNLLRIEQ
jgi:hypothetical protein